MPNLYEESLPDRIGTVISAIDGVAAALQAGCEASANFYFIRHDLEGLYTLVQMIKFDLSEIAGELRKVLKEPT